MKFLTHICLFTRPMPPLGYASMMTIKRCSKVSIPIVKQFLGQNFAVAHALHHVTLSPGIQNNHSYEIFDPYLPIHYATFMRLR